MSAILKLLQKCKTEHLYLHSIDEDQCEKDIELALQEFAEIKEFIDDCLLKAGFLSRKLSPPLSVHLGDGTNNNIILGKVVESEDDFEDEQAEEDDARIEDEKSVKDGELLQ